MENIVSSIPPELRPLFEASTAHDALRAAKALLSETPIDKQIGVLRNPLFRTALSGALAGVDGCAEDHKHQIVLCISKQNQKVASAIISGFGQTL